MTNEVLKKQVQLDHHNHTNNNNNNNEINSACVISKKHIHKTTVSSNPFKVVDILNKNNNCNQYIGPPKKTVIGSSSSSSSRSSSSNLSWSYKWWSFRSGSGSTDLMKIQKRRAFFVTRTIGFRCCFLVVGSLVCCLSTFQPINGFQVTSSSPVLIYNNNNKNNNNNNKKYHRSLDSTKPTATTAVITTTTTSTKLHNSNSNNNNNDNNNLQSSLTSWIRGMSSSIGGGTTTTASTNNMNWEMSTDLSTKIDSWETIRSKYIESCSNEKELHFRSMVQNGLIRSPMNEIRLFGTDTVDNIRVTFYRDSASWCPYCQKVWIMLEEKQISYRIMKVNMNCYGTKPREFMLVQPSGQIPVVMIDQIRTYRQSNDILDALDELETSTTASSRKLIPDPNSAIDQRCNELLRLERQLFSVWMQWLTSNGSGKQRFIDTLNVVENVLSTQNGGPFFLGTSISIVDIQFAPFLERMAASMLYFKGYQIRYPPSQKNNNPYPNINRWFDAMERLPSYQLTKSDYYTHCWDLPPQLGGCVMEREGRPFATRINGDDETSWTLPLQPHNGGIEPDWDDWIVESTTTTNTNNNAQREVVERLSYKYDGIIQFALRGCGNPGYPPVSAPLADPNATSNTNPITYQIVSLCLQLICMKLLSVSSSSLSSTNDSTSSKSFDDDDDPVTATLRQLEEELSSTLSTTADNNNNETDTIKIRQDVIKSLLYLRDRVGVPRDMRLPAARQLRAHLNWVIQNLNK